MEMALNVHITTYYLLLASLAPSIFTSESP